MSYTDPEILYGKLASGDAGRINGAAEPVSAAMDALDRAHGSIRSGTSTSASAWTGSAAETFAARADRSGTATTNARGRLESAVSVVEAAARAYSTMRNAADGAIRAWRNRPADLDEQGLAHLAGQVNEALNTIRSGYENALRAYASSLTEIKPAFAETAGGSESWRQTEPRDGLSVPPPGSDPRAVAQWWDSLSETERDQLMATEFDQLGQLQGLPAEVLDDANRRRIEVDQTRFGVEQADLNARINQRAAELGIDPDDEGALRADPELADLLDQRQDVNRRLDNAEGAQTNLDRADGQGLPGGVHALHYDPNGPGRQEGTLAVAFGNPDTADHVGITVPGTGTTIESNFTGQAAELRRQMDAANPDGTNATIAWLGYDAPSWDTSVVSAEGAQVGGDRLVADVDGYRAAAEAAGNTSQHMTAIGHSYGSTTVGYAGMNGLAVDDTVFVGSPGVGASDVSQLSSGDGHVWAGAAEHDPVVQGTQGSWFTENGSTSPYDDSFGATEFGTPDSGHIGQAHTGYYDPGSESLDNLGNIATGNYDDVTEQSWRDDPMKNGAERTADTVLDAGQGVWETGDHLLNGEWGQAWESTKDTAVEVGSDVLDGVVDGVGGVVEDGKNLYDNTIGRIPTPW